jgi:hypothetical protein
VSVSTSVAAVTVYVSFAPPANTPQLSSSKTDAPVEEVSVATESWLMKKQLSTEMVWPAHSVTEHGCCATVLENGPHA